MPWARAVAARHAACCVHAANSAATLRGARRRGLDMVRCGIAIYGMDPFQARPGRHTASSRRSSCVSYVAEVKRCRAGESAGYGRRFVAERDTWLGTIPIGYGDGVRRGLTNNADVLVGGRRVPLVGHGLDGQHHGRPRAADAEPPRAAAEAVLIGRDGEERILAEEVARAARARSTTRSPAASRRACRASTV